MRKRLKLLAALPLAMGLIGLGPGPALAAPNDDRASCVAQTTDALGPPGQGEDGQPIGGDTVRLLAQFPRNACPGADTPVP